MTTVLQVIPSLDSGGAERTTLEVAQALAERGWGALVASEGGALESELEQAGGRLIRMNLRAKNPLVLAANAARLRRIAAREGVGLIHARSRAPAWSALWAARAARIPFITTYHGAYSGRSAAKRWYNGVMARGDIVIANSAYTRDRILTLHPGRAAPARVRVIPRGVDMDRFDPDAVAPERIKVLRAAWGLAPDDARPVVLLPGRLTFWKGHDMALAALEAAPELDAVLVFAGAGDPEPLRARAAALGLANRVVLAGPVSDMPAAYAAGDLVIAPSTRPEAFGRTAAEAQAMMRPVIAADHGAAPEVVADGETGILVPPGDSAALAEAMRHVLSLPREARARIGAAGRARIKALYTARALQDATLRVYDEALGGR